MDHRPRNSFSMSYTWRKIIFPGDEISIQISLWGHIGSIWLQIVLAQIGEASADADRNNLEINLGAITDHVGDGLEGWVQVGMKWHVETRTTQTWSLWFRQVWRFKWRLWEYAIEHENQVTFKIHLEVVINQVLTCAWSPPLQNLGGDDLESLKMHLGWIINRLWRYPWRPRLSDLGCVLGSNDWASWEVHKEAMTKRD